MKNKSEMRNLKRRLDALVLFGSFTWDIARISWPVCTALGTEYGKNLSNYRDSSFAFFYVNYQVLSSETRKDNMLILGLYCVYYFPAES
jgi:hypothetical protein